MSQPGIRRPPPGEEPVITPTPNPEELPPTERPIPIQEPPVTPGEPGAPPEDRPDMPPPEVPPPPTPSPMN